jgi:hypothetical protein
MTSGSKYKIVGWRLLWCSDLVWRLLDDEVDGTREGSISHFLAGTELLRFKAFIMVNAAGLASPLLLYGALGYGDECPTQPCLAPSWPVVCG